MSNTAVGGTDVEEPADYTKAAAGAAYRVGWPSSSTTRATNSNARTSRSLDRRAPTRPDSRLADPQADPVSEGSHGPVQRRVKTSNEGHTVGPGHPPAATGQVRTPVATDGHSAVRVCTWRF